MEVAKDGIALYEADGSELATPKPKTPQQALDAAREYFEEWMPQAASAQKGFLFFLSQHEHRDAAFMLHQATERLYQGRSEEHTSELQSLMRISYAVFCLKK